MNRALTVIAASGLLFLGAQALADDSKSPSALSRRQLTGCMIKRMTADRIISYNEATKVCKAQLGTEKASLASNNTVAKPANNPR